MRTTSCSDLRKNLAATLDRVKLDHEPVVITRSGGKPVAVLISLDDFASYEETAHLLRSPRNAERLLSSIRQLDERAPTPLPACGERLGEGPGD